MNVAGVTFAFPSMASCSARVSAGSSADSTDPLRWPAPRLRLYQALVAGALLVPALVFAVGAWRDRTATLDAAEAAVRRTVELFDQHARSVLQTHELVAALIDGRLGSMSSDEVERSEQLHQYLIDLVASQSDVQSVWIADAAGRIRNGSTRLPAGLGSVADRDYFRVLREAGTATLIAGPATASATDPPTFSMVRRRETPSGVFDGVIIVAALATEFVEFWDGAVQSRGGFAAIVQRDGALLVAATSAGAVQPSLQSLPAVDGGSFRAVSATDGAEWFYAFSRVDGYDAFVVYGVSVEAALAEWRQRLPLRAGFLAAVALALALTALAALRHARSEAAAVRRWRVTAQRASEECEQRRAVEALLRQAQKMDVLGRLTGTIAHDFNNLLTAVIGNLELLQGRTTDPQDERRIAAALSAADRGGRTIQKLLAVARQQPLREETFDLNEAVQALEPLLRQSIGPCVQLVLDLAPDALLVAADRNQAELAILNLAVNARDAMPDGGTLRIASAGASQRSGKPKDQEDQLALLSVEDTGTGIPPEVLSRVFDPFFTTKPEGRGTGLGLSQVYGFARESGGSASVRSQVGRGTTFTLTLQRARSR